ncbi:MAG: hypothetical protein JJT96_15290, partial [Opitutales bacterium]|nr:hypothetical protein [Opitutales bacterium]
VLNAGGELSAAQLLRCRLISMTQGALIGSRAFVEDWLAERKRHRKKAAQLSDPVGGEVHIC